MFRPTFETGYALDAGQALHPKLWNGLVGAWTPSLGKQGSTLFDVSPYQHNATLTTMDANTDYVPGKFGYALDYDGTDDHIDMGNIPEINNASQDLSISIWARTTASSINCFWYYDDNNSLSPATDFYMYQPANLQIGGIGTTSQLSTSVSVNDGLWHHLVVVLKGATISLYKDGVIVYSVGSAHNHPNYPTSHNFKIADDANIAFYNGSIGDAFLYKRALEPDEISLLYAGITPLTSIFTASPFFVSPDAIIIPSVLDSASEVLSPSIIIDTTVTPNTLDVVTSIETPFAGVVLTVSPSALDSASEVLAPNIIIDTIITPNVIDTLTSVLAPIIPQDAPLPSKIISYNPLLIVTDSDPAKIVEIDTTDPLNPIASVTTLIGAKNAKDIARNSQTGFLYIACADGIVVKVDETNLASQTIIDLSDTDDLQTIEALDAFNITYTSTNSSTGELYMIDERTTVLGDFRLDVLSTQLTYGDFQFDTIEGSVMDGDFTVLNTVSSGYLNTDFKCLTDVLDDIVPIKQTDFIVYVDSVQLEAFDVDLSSITINHTIDNDSIASFTLNRKHDQMDLDLDGNTRQITNQNAIKITIQGRTEFDGFVSNLNCQYSEIGELITVNATAIEKISSFNNVALSLPSLTSRLGLYDILVQNPQIYNPVIDPNAEDPIRFKGIRVDLGEKREESLSHWHFTDSAPDPANPTLGKIASSIQDGTFIPKQNWTYFWGATVRKFGNIELGDTAQFTFLYIGTSLSPVSEDLWILTQAPHKRQRQYDDKISQLGEYTVGVAPFKDINTRNGIFIPKKHWVDKSDGLYSITETGYNFEDYAKEIADLEYQKLLNINDQIVPETSCDVQLTIDGYYYNNLTLLNRINIDNTTQTAIYKNSNGFPVSIKGISINSQNMNVVLTTDNLKSNQELELIDGLFPDEDDDRFNTPERSIRIIPKSNMKTRLSVD